MSTVTVGPGENWTDTVDMIRSILRRLNALAAAWANETDDNERGWLESDIRDALNEAHSDFDELNRDLDVRESRAGARALDAVKERDELDDLIHEAWRDIRMALALQQTSWDRGSGSPESTLFMGDVRAFLADRNAYYRSLDRRA